MAIIQLKSNDDYIRARQITDELHYPSYVDHENVKIYVAGREQCMAKGTELKCEGCIHLAETICSISARIDSVE